MIDAERQDHPHHALSYKITEQARVSERQMKTALNNEAA